MDGGARVPHELRPHVRGHVRSYYTGLAAAQLTVAAALWPLGGAAALGPPVGGLIGFAMVERWRWWRRREEYLTQVRIGAALRTGEDPGPALRPAAEHEAHRVLHDFRGISIAVCVVYGVLALACVVVAVLRTQVFAALPVVPCALNTALLLRRFRASRARAERWLAAPPLPPEDPA